MNRQDRIRHSLDARLSGIKASQNTARKVLAKAQEKEKPMKRKMTLALALTLVLLVGVALAAGLNVFGLFKDDEQKGKQLAQLAEVAQTYAQTTSIPPQGQPEEPPQDDYQKLIAYQKTRLFDFTLEQAYADDRMLYMTYTLKGIEQRVDFHEGIPSGDFEWWREARGKRWQDERIFGDAAQNQMISDHLNQTGSHYVTMDTAGLGDGATLSDGTILSIQDSKSIALDYESVQGFMACQIPEGVQQDQPLEVELVILYGTQVVYQDELGYKEAYVANPANRGIQRIRFTIQRNGTTTSQSGEIAYQAETEGGSYTARAQVFLSPVNVQGTVTITASQAWVDSWHVANATMDEGTGTVDRIFDYTLAAGDKTYPNKDGAISLNDNGDIVIGLNFDAPEGGQMLTLHPVYRDHEALEEAVILK